MHDAALKRFMMLYPVRRTILFLSLVLPIIFSAPDARAQFWHALAPDATSPAAGFSNDEKKVFFVHNENIYTFTIADKYGRLTFAPGMTPSQITAFNGTQPVGPALHITSRPLIVFERPDSTTPANHHLYAVKDDGSSAPEDITPGNQNAHILGESYNGRYIYFTSNKVHTNKLDVYRYDTQQNTSDVVFPNDANYRALAWSRDQTRLLMIEPPSGALFEYDIESTTRTPLIMPTGSVQYGDALFNPAWHTLFLFAGGQEYVTDIGSNEITPAGKAPSGIDYSPNGKYLIEMFPDGDTVKEATTGIALQLPAGSHIEAIAPKETMLLYTIRGKLYLFDIVKKTTVELATL